MSVSQWSPHCSPIWNCSLSAPLIPSGYFYPQQSLLCLLSPSQPPPLSGSFLKAGHWSLVPFCIPRIMLHLQVLSIFELNGQLPVKVSALNAVPVAGSESNGTLWICGWWGHAADLEVLRFWSVCDWDVAGHCPVSADEAPLLSSVQILPCDGLGWRPEPAREHGEAAWRRAAWSSSSGRTKHVVLEAAVARMKAAC